MSCLIDTKPLEIHINANTILKGYVVTGLLFDLSDLHNNNILSKEKQKDIYCEI